MNIWFMIWVFIAVFILGTSLWSLYILLQQKRVWGDFCKKHNLQFISSAVLKSPAIRGLFRDCDISIFSDQQLAGTNGRKSTRTTFQIPLKAPMPTEGAITSASFANFINGLSISEKYEPDFAEWNKKDIVIRVKDAKLIAPYLTKERLVALNALMTIKNSPAMLIFSPTETLLRIESADPFDNGDRLERFLTKLTDAAKIISI